MNVKDACLKKNTVRRKRMYVCPVKSVIENDSEKELQQQNANEMHQTMKNCKKADKTESRSAKGPQTAEKAESEKRGLFHSPVFHITCIIRNACNPKNQVSSLSLLLSSSETRLWVHRLEQDRSAGTSLFVQFRESPASCSDCGCVPKYSQIAS